MTRKTWRTILETGLCANRSIHSVYAITTVAITILDTWPPETTGLHRYVDRPPILWGCPLILNAIYVR